MGTEDSLLWSEADRSTPSSAQIMNGGAIPPPPSLLRGLARNYAEGGIR
jgi:hypothetical protein